MNKAGVIAAFALAALAAVMGKGAPVGGRLRSIAAFPHRRFGDPVGAPSGLSLWTADERNALFDAADRLGIPIDSLGAVIAIESGFNPAAINPGPTKAAGLIQLTTGAALPGFATQAAIANVATWDIQRQIRDVIIPYYSRVPQAKGADPGTLYMLNLLPAFAFEPPDTVIAMSLIPSELDRILAIPAAQRSPEDARALRLHFIYEQNAGFDADKLGFFTVANVKAAAMRALSSAGGKRMNADGSIVGSGIGAKAVEIAMAEIGVKEDPPGSNRGTRIDEYLFPLGLRGVPWCAAFASWCDRQAGGSMHYVASVAMLWSDAKRLGNARPANEDPEIGWLAIFARAGQDPRIGGEGHTGRVISFGPRTVSTIDGNHNNEVMVVTRDRSEVLGWIAV